MHDDVSSDGDLTRVRLTRVEGGEYTGCLVVDMARGLLVRYERQASSSASSTSARTGFLDMPLDEVGRRTPDEKWLGPAVPDLEPGVVRFAG